LCVSFFFFFGSGVMVYVFRARCERELNLPSSGRDFYGT